MLLCEKADNKRETFKNRCLFSKRSGRMAKKKRDSGLSKRFGARYGRKTRYKHALIEAESRKTHKCPYCNKIGVKRIAIGIWNCRKCKAKFTGRAYTPIRKKRISEEQETVEEFEEVTEESKEEAENG